MNILGWHNNAYKWDYYFFISDSFLEANFLTKEIVTIVNVFHNKPHKHKCKCKGRAKNANGNAYVKTKWCNTHNNMQKANNVRQTEGIRIEKSTKYFDMWNFPVNSDLAGLKSSRIFVKSRLEF